jgi:hypothetical protein
MTRNLEAQKARVRTKLDGYGRGAESACARAMAEAERVLRETSVVAPWTHFDLPFAAGAHQAAMRLIGFLQRSNPLRSDFADFRGL